MLERELGTLGWDLKGNIMGFSLPARFVRYLAIWGAVLIPGLFMFQTPAQAWCIVNATPELVHISYRQTTRAGKYITHVNGYVEPAARFCCRPGKKICRGRAYNISVVYPVEQDRIRGPKSARRLNKQLAKLIVRKGVKLVTRVGRFMPSSGYDSFSRPPIAACPGIRYLRDGSDLVVYGPKGNTACDVMDQKDQYYIRTYKSNKKARGRSNVAVCNRTGTINKLYVTVAWYARDTDRGKKAGYWQSSGHYTAELPGCIRIPIGEPYYTGDIYYRITGGGKVWGGKDAYFCINKKKAFSHPRADKKCPAGFEKAGFFKKRIYESNQAVVVR